MITKLELSFGAKPGTPALDFAPGPVTVFVGPNNSGKSLVLREIGASLFDTVRQNTDFWEGYIGPAARRIVRKLELPVTEWIHIRRHFENVDTTGMIYVGSLLASRPHHSSHINPARLLTELDQQRQPDMFEHARLMVLRSQVEMLDGQRRLNLLDPRPTGDLKQRPTNLLQSLFRDDVRRRRLAAMTKEAFGRHFVIDPTRGEFLQVAMSAELPKTIEEERSLSEAAIRFF